jgi:hypothetical protein
MSQQAQRIEPLIRPELGRLQDPLEMGGDQKGRGRTETTQQSSSVEASKRLRMANDPPESNVPVAKRTETVWYIGEQTKWRSSGSKFQTAASSSKTACAVPSSQMPVVTPLGCPVVPEG